MGCSHGKAVNTKDSGTSDKDLAPAPDEAAGKDPFHADAGADTGEDAALPDLPAANRDVGREGRVSPRDAASGNRDQGAGVDGGEPSTCTGILSLGDYLMSSSPRMISPLTMADLNGDGLVDLVSPGRVAFGKGNGTFSAPVDFKNPADPARRVATPAAAPYTTSPVVVMGFESGVPEIVALPVIVKVFGPEPPDMVKPVPAAVKVNAL